VSGWLQTYRGIVYRWEVDHNDHLTVAYYFARLGDAALALLDALGLGAGYARRRGRVCVTADCYVRYLRELRVGDIMHIASGSSPSSATPSCSGTRSSTPRRATSARRSSSGSARWTPGAAPPGRSQRRSGGPPSAGASSGTARRASAARGLGARRLPRKLTRHGEIG